MGAAALLPSLVSKLSQKAARSRQSAGARQLDRVSYTHSGCLLRWCIPVGWMTSLRGYIINANDPKKAMKGKMQA